MNSILIFLQSHPLIPLFITLGLGFLLGKMRLGSFSLGTVAATLIVGVAVGQMKIEIPDMLKTVFFLFFLFSTGYSVAPQFFRSFKGPGVRMACFAVAEALVSAALVIGAAKLMGYSNGVAAGLYAGSQTVSASLGVLADTVKELGLTADARDHMLMIIPACYAVTYVLGTVGTAWYLSSMGPRLLGGLDKVKSDIADIEQHLDTDATATSPGIIPAARPVVFRAYELTDEFFDEPQTVADTEAHYSSPDRRIVVERVREGGRIFTPSPDTMLAKGDRVVLGARAEAMSAMTRRPGPEVADSQLLNFGAERTPVTVAGKTDGVTIGKLRSQSCMNGVVIASVKRNGMSIPVLGNVELHAGDVITIVGWPRDVATAAEAIGYADRATDATDMVFVGLGIAVGCLIGALSLKISGIPFALGASTGALLSGLALGWLRTRRPSFGHIPSAALWIFNNLGVNMFISVLGITAGGALMHGVREAGWLIVAVGALLTLLSLTINIFIARKVFRFSTPDTLGCVAGGHCSVAAIGAIRDTLQSDVPNLGFTVCYAMANIALVFASLAVLFLV